jgi:hypothetical protein
MSLAPVLNFGVVLVLSALLAATASAQSEATLNFIGGQVVVLQGKVTILETRVQNDHDASLLMRAQLDQARKDITKLQQDMLTQQVVTAALQSAIVELLKRPPEDPSKPTPRKPSDEPTDNQSSNVRAPFIVKDNSGRILFKVDVGPGGNGARATIGNAAGNRIEIGSGSGGSAAVTLFDDSNTALAALVGDPKGSFLRVKDNEQSALLGRLESEGRGLSLRKGANEFVTLSPDKTGAGTVKVFAATGNAVAGLFADANGGQLVLTGPGGGKTEASMSATSSGGRVRVFPVGGGTVRAELAADGAKGAVNIFGSDGSNAASLTSLESKTGRLEINNADGSIVVEAGATKPGAGYVTTGPYDTGVAASMLSVGKPASSLLGSLKSK